MAKCRLWVYNAEIFFVASGHPFAPVIRRTKRNSKKVYFWDTLVCNDVAHYVFVVLAQFLQIVVGIQSILSTIVTHLIALTGAFYIMSSDMRSA